MDELNNSTDNSKNVVIVALAVIIVVVIAGVLLLGRDNTTETGTVTPDPDPTTTEPAPQDETVSVTTPPANDTTEPAPSAVDSGSTTQAPPTPNPAPNAGVSRATYTDYSESQFNQARNEGKNVVLFFHANWCPTCRALDSEIKSELGNIPPNTDILKVDYDSSSSLKREHEIRYQHTLVFIKGTNPPPYPKLQGGRIDEVIFQIQSL